MFTCVCMCVPASECVACGGAPEYEMCVRTGRAGSKQNSNERQTGKRKQERDRFTERKLKQWRMNLPGK